MTNEWINICTLSALSMKNRTHFFSKKVFMHKVDRGSEKKEERKNQRRKKEEGRRKTEEERRRSEHEQPKN